MKKTYWWRVLLTALSVFILSMLYFGFCGAKFGRCIGGNDILMVRTLFHIFLAIIVICPFLFFVKDTIFKKWKKFAIIWILFEIIVIIITPEYQREFISLPDKEVTSFLFNVSFVIISIVILAYQSYKLRKK